MSSDIVDQIFASMAEMEKVCGKKFGDAKNPLLVAVRSGSRASMPGMMDTILNLGLNDEVCEGLSALTGNPRFAYDSYRRFIQMFSDVVMEVPKKSFEAIIDEAKEKKGVTDSDHQDSPIKTAIIAFNYFNEAAAALADPALNALIASIEERLKKIAARHGK
jgi:pyruvate,orthophosphate dikinase